jgi:hypothetical protein
METEGRRVNIHRLEIIKINFFPVRFIDKYKELIYKKSPSLNETNSGALLLLKCALGG